MASCAALAIAFRQVLRNGMHHARRYSSEPLWFHSGLKFECTKCGKCCFKPVSQAVKVNMAEQSAISEHLGMSLSQMRQKHIKGCVGPYTSIS
jgi:hypothetical protein